MKSKIGLVIAAILIISVLSAAFTSASEGNTSGNLTDSNRTAIGNNTLFNESSEINLNLTGNISGDIMREEEQQKRFMDPFYEEWQKRHELFEHPKSIEDIEKEFEERKMPRMPEEEIREDTRFNISQIQERMEAYGMGTYFNITGNYSELWNETHDANYTYAYIIPDLDGDDNPDVLVYTGKYDPLTDTRMEKVIVKKGSDGTHLWEESVSVTGGWCGIYARPVGDLDGDGLDDVIVGMHKRVHATDTEMGNVIAKKGSDGTHLWEESVSVTGGYCGIYAYLVGDLDGDGLDDVIVEMHKRVHATDTEMGNVIAKKGSDGTHLWEESVSVTGGWCGIYARPVGDLDGNGLGDVIVEMHKRVHATDTGMGNVIAKKGSDGTHLWEESVSVTGGYCGIYAYLVGDLDGDGLDDVIVEMHKRVHATDTEMGKVIAKKGSDGTHLWEESVSVTGGYCGIYARPVGDLDGNGLGDVIAEMHKRVHATDTEMGKVIAKKGSDGTHLWEESVSVTGGYCGIYAYLVGDLDGDGLDDVIVEMHKRVHATDTGMGNVIAKKGSDGTHLWEESVSVTGGYCGIYAYLVGDLDGNGLDDVIVGMHKRVHATDTEMGNVIAKKGSDGTHLWEESVSVTGGYCGIYAYLVGDLDGDGLDDVIVGMHKRVHATDTEMGKVIAKKGSDGTHLWEESVSVTGGYCGIYARPVGDLDGDGLDDVIVHWYKHIEATDTETEGVIAKKGSDGTHLWEESVSSTGANSYCGIYARPVGDLDGDGLDDVIVTVYTAEYDFWTEEWTYNYTVIAKRGYDGEHFWKAQSDEPIWIAEEYWWYYKAHAPMVNFTTALVNETMPAMPMSMCGIPMNLTTPPTPSPPPPPPPPQPLNVSYGYDLNGDGICDILLGTSTEVHAVTTTVPPPPNEVYFIPSESKAPFCDTTDVEIWVHATDKFQSGQMNITYDQTCANVTNWTRNTTNFPMGTWTHKDGNDWITFVGYTLKTGEYMIGTLTIHCVNESEDGCKTTLDFVEPSKLVDDIGNKVSATWKDGSFKCEPGICGDVNCDKIVDIGDVTLLLNHVGDPVKYPLCDEWAGDVNCDKVIDIGDVTLLLNHVGDPVKYPLNCC